MPVGASSANMHAQFLGHAAAGIAHLVFQIWHAQALDLLVVGEAFGVGRAEIHACVISGEMRGFSSVARIESTVVVSDHLGQLVSDHLGQRCIFGYCNRL